MKEYSIKNLILILILIMNSFINQIKVNHADHKVSAVMSPVFFCTASGLQFPHFLQTANRKVKQLSQGLAPVFGLQSGQKHAQKHLCVRAPPFSIMLSNWRLCWEGLTAAVLLRTHAPPTNRGQLRQPL